MLLTTTCGPSASQGQQKIPTTPTIKQVVIFVLNTPATISTTDRALGSNVNSNTSVSSVTRLATTKASVTIRARPPQQVLHPQLRECTFSPVTPVNYLILNRLLRDHPNRSKVHAEKLILVAHKGHTHKVNNVVQGFQAGFSLKYNGLLEKRQPKNLLSAYRHADKLWDSIMKEV